MFVTINVSTNRVRSGALDPDRDLRPEVQPIDVLHAERVAAGAVAVGLERVAQRHAGLRVRGARSERRSHENRACAKTGTAHYGPKLRA